MLRNPSLNPDAGIDTIVNCNINADFSLASVYIMVKET